MLLLARCSSSSVAPTNSTRAKQWLCWTASSAFLVLACPQWWLGTKHALSAHCLWQERSAGTRGLPSRFWPFSEQQQELGQGHSSVHVFNCTCDDHGRVLSEALSAWPGTGPSLLDSEADTLLSGGPCFCFCGLTLFVVKATGCCWRD